MNKLEGGRVFRLKLSSFDINSIESGSERLELSCVLRLKIRTFGVITDKLSALRCDVNHRSGDLDV